MLSRATLISQGQGRVLTRSTGLTTVTATVVDPQGQPYAEGWYRFTFWVPPGITLPPNWLGGHLQTVFVGNLDASGSFTVDIPDNLTITPSGTMWKVMVAPLATAPSTEVLVVITGASQDISAEINEALADIAVPIDPAPIARPLARAYTDDEVIEPVPGAIYFNITDKCVHFYDGTTWHNLCQASGGADGGTGWYDSLYVDTLWLNQLVTVCGGLIPLPPPPGLCPVAIESSNMFGQPQDGQVVLLHTFAKRVVFPANFSNPNSYGNALGLPAADATYTVNLKLAGVSSSGTVGTATISPSGVFTFATVGTSGFAANPGDMLWMSAPSPMDSTLSDVAITLVGTTPA